MTDKTKLIFSKWSIMAAMICTQPTAVLTIVLFFGSVNPIWSIIFFMVGVLVTAFIGAAVIIGTEILLGKRALHLSLYENW